MHFPDTWVHFLLFQMEKEPAHNLLMAASFPSLLSKKKTQNKTTDGCRSQRVQQLQKTIFHSLITCLYSLKIFHSQLFEHLCQYSSRQWEEKQMIRCNLKTMTLQESSLHSKVRILCGQIILFSALLHQNKQCFISRCNVPKGRNQNYVQLGCPRGISAIYLSHVASLMCFGHMQPLPESFFSIGMSTFPLQL